MQNTITYAFAETETRIRILVGINAEEPVEDGDDLYGTAVIRAARVMGEADGREIRVADVVRQLGAAKPYPFSDWGGHALEGSEESLRLFALGRRSRS